MEQDIFWCKKCLATSTRPMVTFDEEVYVMLVFGFKKKSKIDWAKRDSS